MIPESTDTRCALMLEVAFQTIVADPDLRLCEGLRLIEATRRAIVRIAPGSVELFEAHVLPQMQRALLDRFGLPSRGASDLN